MKPRLLLLLIPAVLPLAACDRSRPEKAEPAPEENVIIQEEYVGPLLTPAESTALVEKTRADEEEMTRRVRGRPPGGGPVEPVGVHVETPEKIYENCLAQARSVEEPTRGVILAACEAKKPR